MFNVFKKKNSFQKTIEKLDISTQHYQSLISNLSFKSLDEPELLTLSDKEIAFVGNLVLLAFLKADENIDMEDAYKISLKYLYQYQSHGFHEIPILLKHEVELYSISGILDFEIYH